jgi:hypothetical protein
MSIPGAKATRDPRPETEAIAEHEELDYIRR